MRMKNKRIVAATVVGLGTALGSAVVAAGPAAAISGPTACNDIVNPGRVQFFGAVNCYKYNVLFFVSWKGQWEQSFACVRPGHTLWEDSSAAEIGFNIARMDNYAWGVPTPCSNPTV